MRSGRHNWLKFLTMTLMLCIAFINIFILDVSLILAETGIAQAQLTKEEIAWIKAHPTIRLAPDPNFEPIEFFDKTGNYQGIGADYMRLVTKKLGIQFEVVKCKSWDDVLARMERREVDVLNAVVKTPQREKYLVFPPPYLKIPSVIIVRKTVTKELTLDMLKGMRIVMVSGYGYVDLIRNNHPDIEIELVADLKAALRKVSFGMADAFVGDLATASFYIESEGITNLKLAGETDPPNISGFAVRSDWPELSSILEKGVSLLTAEERKNIQNKWIRLGTTPGITKQELKKMALFTVLVMLLIVGAFLIWNRMLNRLVHQRTEALRKEVEERKQAEDALYENQIIFQLFLENSPVYIFFKDHEIRSLMLSRNYEQLLGMPLEKIIGRTMDDLFPSDLAKKMIEDDKKILQEGVTVNVIEEFGGRIYETTKFPIFINNKPNMLAGFTLDITDRTKAEEETNKLQAQLLHTQKMEAIGTLSGGIAHDFNNILAAIIGYAEMAKNDIPDWSPAKHQIGEVLKAGIRAKELVKQILSFSRQGEQKQIPVQIDLVIKEVLNFLRASIPTTIDIKLDITPSCGNTLAAPTQIHQILMNLCTNAAQAMEENGGILGIDLSVVDLTSNDLDADSNLQPGPYILLVVSDTGTGIKKEILGRIFDPYFTTKEFGKGSGMGLSVVHGIVHSHGGMITVESIPGKGTTFKLYLPKIKEAVQEVEAVDTSPLPPGKGKILIVDDDASLATLTKKQLEMFGYEAIAMTNSKEALEHFRTESKNYVLVITDQTMPYMTGEQLAGELFHIRPDIPIIMCTGYSSRIDANKADSIGIKAFLMKPVDNKELSRTIRKVLDSN